MPWVLPITFEVFPFSMTTKMLQLPKQGIASDYCPIFDNGAGLLSNVQMSPMDIDPKALIAAQRARPFNTTFNRQVGNMRSLYGRQFHMPKLTRDEIRTELAPLLTYYAERDRGIITDRVCETIRMRQRF